MMTGKTSQASTIAGFSVIGAFVVGIAAGFFALLAVFNEYDYIGAGLCLLAAATAFGHVMNTVYRA
jgi:hypothetical protein